MIQNEDMQRYCALILLVVMAGCGGSFDQQVVGTWRVDAASVKTSRLLAGSENNQDWKDATAAMAEVQIQFDKNGTATAKGFDATTSAKWKLIGTSLVIEGAEDWPDLNFDPGGPRLHAKMTKGADELTMDFVKVR
jgi:hypothetical protein